MSYTPKLFGKPQEDQQEDAGLGNTPALGSSGIGMGAGSTGAGGGVPQAPQAAKAQAPSAGTGFVNIDRMIGANQGIGSQISERGTRAVNEDKGRFQIAETAATRGMNSNAPNMGSLDAATRYLGGAGKEGDEDTIKAGLSGTYGGPTSIGYNIGQGDAIRRAGALSNAQSAGRQIASEQAGGLASYDPRMSAIDAALYGQEASAQAARKDLTANIDKNKKDQQARSGDFATRAQGEQTRAQELAANLRGQLGRGAQGIRTEAGAQATQGSGNGVTLSAENFVSPEQSQRLSFIAQALGDPSIAMESRPRDLTAESQARFENASDVAGQNVIKQPGTTNTRRPTTEEFNQAAWAQQFPSGWMGGPMGTPRQQAAVRQTLQDQVNADSELFNRVFGSGNPNK